MSFNTPWVMDTMGNWPILKPRTTAGDWASATTIRQHYVEALMAHPEMKQHPELQALLKQVLQCDIAEVWEASFVELLHPSDAGPRAFLQRFMVLWQRYTT